MTLFLVLFSCVQGLVVEHGYKTLDILTVHLPFLEEDAVRCTHGPNGPRYTGGVPQEFFVVLDSPDGEDDGGVYAPVMGHAYPHFDAVDGGLAHHVKIDLQDGSYLLVARMSEVFVLTGEYVLVGSLLGREGIAGRDNGSDILLGRYFGDPRLPGKNDPSLASLMLRTADESRGFDGVFPVYGLDCGGGSRSVYRSRVKSRGVPPWQQEDVDDLEEDITWLRVYGENIGLQEAGAWSWHVFPEGEYVVRIESVEDRCVKDRSVLCCEQEEALCLASEDGDIVPTR